MQMKKTKIVYCIPSLYSASGMERVLTQKANFLADQLNYSVTIVLTDGKNAKPFYPLSPNVSTINLDINYNELYNKSPIQKITGYQIKQFYFKKRLAAVLKEIRPNITVSLLRREINFITHLKDDSLKMGEIHFSKATYRDSTNFKVPTAIRKIIRFFWMQQLILNLKKLNRFIVLTEEDDQLWKELDNTAVIPNPLSFKSREISTCESKQVIAAGRLVPQKGFDLLIKAWEHVHANYPDWQLTIYGNGDPGNLLELAKTRQIENSVTIKPAVSNIQEKYLESSVFVLSSRYEGFGLVLTEAMECGLPVVSFSCPCGPRDIVRDGEDGFLAEPENSQQLAEKIELLIENGQLRKKMGENARKNVQRFNIESIMQQWDHLFQNALQQQSKD